MVIWVRGAGDLASGIAYRLHQSGFSVVLSDLAVPTSIRRTVCFSEAIIKGTTTVENVTAERAKDADEAKRILSRGNLAVLADDDIDFLVADQLMRGEREVLRGRHRLR